MSLEKIIIEGNEYEIEGLRPIMLPKEMTKKEIVQKIIKGIRYDIEGLRASKEMERAIKDTPGHCNYIDLFSPFGYCLHFDIKESRWCRARAGEKSKWGEFELYLPKTAEFALQPITRIG